MPYRNWIGFIIVSRGTTKPVFETQNRKIADLVDLDRYEVLTVAGWLERLFG